MPTKIDLLGRTFGTLTVVEELQGKQTRNGFVKGKFYRCECSCGGEVITTTGILNKYVRQCSDCKSNKAKKELLGKVFETKKYGKYRVISYIDSKNIEVEFLDTGYRKISELKEVKTCKIKDPLVRNVCGVGYFGVGEYQGAITENGRRKNTPAYEVWIGIIKRCYSKEKYVRVKCPTYENVSVCDEWLCFQTFAEWYYSNIPNYDSPAVDKDLKVIDSKIYSPETCSFVPYEVNSLFTGTNGNRDLPRGVHFCNTKKVYVVQLQEGALTRDGTKKQTYYGQYLNPEEAVAVYIKEKKRHVAEVANRNKDKIDPIVYYNLVNNCEKFL